jgi:ornithine cyclodeaminase/alanine dehydrogenase-like protein (mu-crystallin family)
LPRSRADIFFSGFRARDPGVERHPVARVRSAAAGAMSAADVHAQLGEIVAGLKRARESEEEIIVFDSTGTALQDVAAATAAYRQALADSESRRFSFNA